MARFWVGVGLSAASFAVTQALTENVALAVFIAAMVAIGVWFRGFELILDCVASVLD